MDIKTFHINQFKDDVYVGIDKELLRNKLSSITAVRIARYFKLNRDTVERWYRDEVRAIPIYALKHICNVTNTGPSEFKIEWIGGKGYPRNRLIPFLNPDLAYFIGLVVGDGHLYENRIVISGEEQFIKKIVVPHCQKLFPTMKIIARDMKDCFWAELNSRPLVWFVRDIFNIPIGKKVFIVNIPEIIRQDNQLLPSFLQGLYDSDGYIAKNGAIAFFTASSNLKESVIKSLIKLGFKPGIRIDKRGKNPVYHIRFASKESIKMFKEKISFKHPFKISRLRAFC